MANPTKYIPSEQVRLDLQAAYSGYLRSKDILDKLRIAGEPKADREVQLRAMGERLERFAKAFDIPLE